MGAKRFKYRAGFTLVEIMVTIAVLMIAIIGTSAFRYNTALSAREAEAKTDAARIAQVLCESWRSASDPNEFDAATALDLKASFGSAYATIFAIDGTEHGPYVADGFTPSGYYKIRIDDNDEGDEITYWVTLSWQDVSPGLRALNIVVGWDPRSAISNYYWGGGSGRTFKLTTYVTY
jgi:prepilin-type N-terminal cleavage/methylation domain-containing protein